MLKKSLISSVFFIISCASQTDETINTINSLKLPTVNSAPETGSYSLNELTQQHIINQDSIRHISDKIKLARTNHIRAEDVMDTRTDINKVFQALTQLEQAKELNDLYLKEKNMTGLLKIGETLKPLLKAS
ncbi:hypothetical protein A9993_12200 [Rahnella victoriana]|uniref:hypothetical protein n=1 Tax=Rahnella victoriana TaxID=1510570 RepID=UPI000BB1C5BC|nr:hypothetical protein [Rahnella victoriana]PBI80443.1 hypothetical protein A9993_12200 [Rahnella victoriana]